MDKPPKLLPHHTEMLTKASGISQEVITARGYRSIESKAELKRLGFSDTQLLVPTLLIPIWSVTGEIALYHHRPDSPRIRDGKPAKYELPARSRMAVDVHPMIRDQVRDPAVPLFITEGAKKADAAISRDLCCIALIGTWNWRGTNEHGGKTALPDWEHIALKDRKDQGRQVYICFDSDVMIKPQVHQALVRLSAFLEQRGASVVYIYLPHGEGGCKVGLDDYLAAGHTVEDLLALATPELRNPPQDEDERVEARYRETPRGLVWIRDTRDGPVETPLTNFTARIVAQTVEDDGAESRLVFEIEAQRNGTAERFSVPAEQFPSVSRWAVANMGAGALVFPGFGLADHARAAIQILSGDPPRRRVYLHTGWRELQPGTWAYLHAGGAIGPVDPESVAVHLDGALAGYRLPQPPIGDALLDALQASLRLIDLAPDPVVFPIFAAVWRAPLGPSDFSLFLAGQTGIFKTEQAALALQHFGTGMDARNLPGTWTSTDNQLEDLAFSAKDALLVIDDFNPHGGQANVQHLHAKADRVLRAQGNRTGRGRLRRDGTPKPYKPPRGLILSTGEDIPQGQSLRARALILEVSQGDIDPDRLTPCQQDAAAGLYAQAMSGFLAWLAPRYDEVRRTLRSEVEALRSEATRGGHARTPEIISNLAVGLRHFLAFAQEAGTLSHQEAQDLWQRGWQALTQAADAQARHLLSGEPTRRYLELLSAALSSGRAHVADVEGGAPLNPGAWGWREHTVGTGMFERQEWQPQGDRIGWTEGDDLYLQPNAAFNVAKRLGNESGDGISITPRTLNKRLHERRLLASVDQAREVLTVRRTICGKREDTLHFYMSALMCGKPDQPDQPDHAKARTQENQGVSDPAGRVLWSGSEPEIEKPDQETRPGNQENQGVSDPAGRNGRVGRVPRTYKAPCSDEAPMNLREGEV